jgi:hypothetical protein
VATWNLARSGGTDRTDLLAAEGVELLCAQEVTARAHEEVLSSGLFDWGLLSLHHLGGARPANLREGLGVGVYGRSPMRVRASGILPAAARPEKMLFVEVELEGWGHPVAVVSCHAAPGHGKPVNTLQVAHWLELRTGPIIVGLDANSPKIYRPDREL